MPTSIKQLKDSSNILHDLDNRYIELSATSGTLTEEQLATLQASSKNYIIHNGFIYTKTGENNDYLWYGFEDTGLEHFYFYTINKSSGAFGFTSKTYTEKASPATAGNIAELTAAGGIQDSGIVASDIQKSITKEAENDPDNSSFGITVNDGQDAPLVSTVIKGRTVAVNQLSRPIASATTVNGITVTPNADGSVTLNGTATASGIITSFRNIDAVNGHSYYIKMVSSASVSGLAVYTLIGGSTGLTEGIQTAIATGSQDVTLRGDNGAVYNNVKVFVTTTDLTARGFTSAETTDVATLKAAWLKKYGTPLPVYIPHDTGSLKNTDGKYVLHGRNIWDEESADGYWDVANGEFVSATNWKASKNHSHCNASAQYYVKCGTTPYSAGNVLFYDANKNYIGYVATPKNSAFTTPDNAAYFTFYMAAAYFDYDICINLSDPSINGQYFPHYNGGTIDCSASPLNGFDDTVCDEKDYATGERITQCKEDDFGDLNWFYASDGAYPYMAAAPSTPARKPINNTTVANVLCGVGVSVAAAYIRTQGAYGIAIDDSGLIRFASPSMGTDPAAFKTAMTGKKICYELATPTTTIETPQPVETQYGFNVFEPVSGGVQSAEVKIRYISDKGTSEIIDYVDNAISTSILGAINTTY